MKPTLLILAAGMASRYGSMKQTEGFGPNAETIMDYSIYDAIQAGFGKVVFIIRKDFQESFKAQFGDKLKHKITVEYVFQEMDSFVEAQYLPEGRTKPWGTAHAMLCAKDAVKEPFAVINADDFYGNDAFTKAFNFLTDPINENTYAIIGYRLSNTLSERGALIGCRIMHVIAVAAMVVAGVLVDAGVWYAVGVAVCAAILLWENVAVRGGDRRAVQLAFGVANGVVAFVYFAFVLIEVVTH